MNRKIKNLLVSLDNIKVDEKSLDTNDIIKKIENLRNKQNISSDELIELQNYEQNLISIYREKLEHNQKKEKKSDTEDNKTSPEDSKETDIKRDDNNNDLLYRVDISDNKMEAYISFYNITDDFGLTEFYIKDLLKRNNVVKGIIDERIKKLLEKMHNTEKVENFLIAKGKYPEKGADGYIKYLLKHNNELESLYREKYNDRKIWRLIINKVKKGDVLAERVPPEQGKSGYTVTGEKLKGLFGVSAELKIKRNVVLKDNKYVSEIDGECIIENLYIRVRKYASGHFNINVSPNKMLLKINLYPSIGDGPPIELNDIKDELKRIGIKADVDFKLLEEKIKICELEKKAIYDLILAVGTEPINGKDGYIYYKVKPGTGKNFKILPNGRVDYKERDIITTIKENELIAIVYKPEEGKSPGYDLFGNSIPAKPGNKVVLKGGKNVVLKEYDNRTEYYSKIDGHLKLENEEIYVLPVYIHNGNVDLSIGNIRFPGDVIIKGDILDEFTVIAEGDIFIEGNVGAAVIKSDRSIIVKKGIMAKSKGKIYAGGSIVAKFIENGIVEADGNIIVEKAIINSDVLSNSILSVVLDKGQIIGGSVSAGRRIEAKVIGSPSGIKTEVSVGYNFILKKEYDNLKKEKMDLSRDLDRVEEIISQLFKEIPDIKKFSDDMKKVYVESIRKKAIIINELKKINESERNLDKISIIVSNNPEIVVYDYIYSDVKINFLDNTFVTRDKNVHVKIKFDSEKNIVFDMLM